MSICTVKLAAIAMLVCVLPTSTRHALTAEMPHEEKASIQPGDKVRVSRDVANLQCNGDIVGTLRRDAQVTVLAVHDEWLQVDVKTPRAGGRAWIHRRDVEHAAHPRKEAHSDFGLTLLTILKLKPRINPIENEGVAIDFAKTRVSDSDADAFASLTGISRLGFKGTAIGDPVILQLASNFDLKSLYLENTLVTDASAESLRSLANLESLSLTGCSEITDRTLESISALKELRILGLGKTGISTNGLENIQHLEQLQLLNLGFTQIDDGAASAINRLSSLRILRLQETAFGDRGIAALSNKQRLVELQLIGTPVSDASVSKLGQFKTLRLLLIRGTRISDRGYQQLQALLPRTRIVR